MIERPLDLLDSLKDLQVCVKFKDEKEIIGILIAFDIHINLVLDIDEVYTFLRGDNILSVYEYNEPEKKEKR
jgi:small nuclear ribonucleoprotein (snRNP)-like protein